MRQKSTNEERIAAEAKQVPGKQLTGGTSKLIGKSSDYDDYLSFKVAESAKKKVLAYFAVLGVLVSIVVTLFGLERIRALVDDQYVTLLKKKEQDASDRVKRLTAEFETQLADLQKRAETRSAEFHQIVGISLEQVRGGEAASKTVVVDISANIGPIRDQGDEGTTVGFSVAYALAAEVKRTSGTLPLFSARSIYIEAKKHDDWPGENYEGTSVLGAMKALVATGAYLESDWPYQQKTKPLLRQTPTKKIATYTKIPTDRLDGIVDALKAGKAVVISLSVTEAFSKVGTDGKVLIIERQRDIAGHSVCIVGYSGSSDEFKFANMWGSIWGSSGFGYIRRSDLQKLIIDAFTLSL